MPENLYLRVLPHRVLPLCQQLNWSASLWPFLMMAWSSCPLPVFSQVTEHDLKRPAFPQCCQGKQGETMLHGVQRRSHTFRWASVTQRSSLCARNQPSSFWAALLIKKQLIGGGGREPKWVSWGEHRCIIAQWYTYSLVKQKKRASACHRETARSFLTTWG